MYDMIIVGAGPAGSVLARELGRHYKVLLMDRRRFTGETMSLSAEKCCGGLLDPSAQKALASLKIGLPRQVLRDPQVFSIRAIDFDNHMERFYPKRYINIDRVEFDRYLLSLALKEDGVSFLEEATLLNYHESGGMVQVQFRKDGQVRYLAARYLIGADGAASRVRRLKNRDQEEKMFPPREYACLQQWFRTDEAMPYYVAAFDRYITDFYSWMIPKGDRVIVGSAIPKGEDVKLKFTYLKTKLTQAGFSLKEPVYESGALLLRPLALGSVDPGKGRVFLIGEAAGLISPSSAEGVSYAVTSAVCLAEVFDRGGGHMSVEDYEASLLGLKLNIGLKSLKSPVMYNPLLRGLVFKTRLLSL